MPGAPKPFTVMPLTLANAYGGADEWDELPVPYPANPVGKGYALDADETRGLLAGAQYTRVLVDTTFANVKPDVMGYVGGYYQWDNNWKFT